MYNQNPILQFVLYLENKSEIQKSVTALNLCRLRNDGEQANNMNDQDISS